MRQLEAIEAMQDQRHVEASSVLTCYIHYSLNTDASRPTGTHAAILQHLPIPRYGNRAYRIACNQHLGEMQGNKPTIQMHNTTSATHFQQDHPTEKTRITINRMIHKIHHCQTPHGDGDLEEEKIETHGIKKQQLSSPR